MTKTMGMWREHTTGTATDTTHVLVSEAVPVAQRRYLAQIAVSNDTTANSDADIFVISHGVKVGVGLIEDVPVGGFDHLRCGFWMTEGEYIQAVFRNVNVGDNLVLDLVGHIQYSD